MDVITSVYALRGRVSEVGPAKILSGIFPFFIMQGNLLDLGPTSCPAKMHCTAVFALKFRFCI